MQGPAQESEVREQLTRILSSHLFMRSRRLSAFLRFVTERTLNDGGNLLKEHRIGVELYGKGADFDGAVDPIVRVDARRLRDKLREYYGDHPRDPVVISLPKGSYAPVFAFVPVNDPSPRVQRRIRLPLLRGAALVVIPVLLIGFASSWYARRTPPFLKIIPVAQFQGNKLAPALSPDGRFLAFSSTGPEKVQRADLWVEDLQTGSLRRLTDTPTLIETSPSWSPDGRQIAFLRDGSGIYIMPCGGGPEKKISATGTWVVWASGWAFAADTGS
jgi:hypothetical protein